jgi:hypothetical protein
MSEFAIAHDRKQPRATMPAKVDYVVFVFAKFGNALLTARQLKLFLANASERAESWATGGPTVGTMAVSGVEEFIGNWHLNSSAQAFSD